MSDHKAEPRDRRVSPPLTRKRGLETTDSTSNRCFSLRLLKHFGFQRGSRFCPLAQVETSLATLGFNSYYVDLDLIERVSALFRRRRVALRPEDFQLDIQGYLHNLNQLL